MNYTNKTKNLIVGAVFAVAFLTVMALPTSTNACGNYGDRCGYNQPSYIPQRPVYVSAPTYVAPQPVYIQQPVIQQPVYQQPVIQPVYITQPVIQQPTYIQQQPVYVQQPVIQPVYIAPMTVSCSANNSSNGNYNNGYSGYNNGYNNSYNNGYSNSYNNGYNNSVTWTAYASGGNGNYSYSWSGTDGLNGSGQNVSFNYNNAGSKYAYVTVYSNGQSATQSCNTTIAPQYIAQPIIQQPVYVQQPVYQQPSYNLDIGCYADPTNARVNQPVTWSVEVTGGMAPYTYNWSGTDNLTGSLSSITKYYNSTGSKSAIVSVTSADGKTGTRACSNSLTIAGASNYVYKAPAPVKKVCQPCQVEQSRVTEQPSPVSTVNNSNQTAAAASLFSLSNVPWGWVAILVILVLFVTIMYLLLNKQKI
jgi:hypothetical protein